MLRIIQNRSPDSAKSYYSEGLSREDYYSENHEVAGKWGGKGSERLGLVGQVEHHQFEMLCDNTHPLHGGNLTPRSKADRTVGYDFNFHAPKSVSVQFAETHDPRIVDAFRASVNETMRELEAEAKTRIRKDGQNAERVTGELTWAEFIHFTARPIGGVPDPHLHAHCFTFNATFDSEENRWKAGQFRDLKRDAPYWEAAFHARFARNLADQGFAIERTAKGWELAGYQKSTLDKFSRRTAQIEDLAKEKGILSAAGKDSLGAATRERKQKELTSEGLHQEWDSRLTDAERDAIKAVERREVKSKSPEVSAAEAMSFAIAHSYERHSVTSEKLLMREALRHGVGSVTVEAIQREVKREGIITATVDGQRLSTTHEVLAEEQKMLAFARNGRGTCHASGRPDQVIENALLSDEQQKAARHAWDSHDRVILIRGAAGVGKTTLMKEVVSGIEANGTKVFAFAPSADASRDTLRKEGFVEADTVARLLLDRDLQERVRGQVIWADEAGQLGTRQMSRLFDLADRLDCKIILTGDSKQHASVERGDALRLLETHAGVIAAQVVEIRRQKGAYKEAVKALSRGDISGFDKLDAMGAIREVEGAERHKQLAQDYLEAVAAGKSALVVAPTHAEGAAITAEIRRGLKEKGALGKVEREFSQLTAIPMTEAMRGQSVHYDEPGLTVQITQNIPGLKRGERLAVLGRDEEGAVQARRGNGDVIALPLHHADRFQVYGSSSVSFAAGDTVRITQNGYTNDKRHRLNNGAVYRIKGFTAKGDLRLENDWVVDKSYGHLAHGVVTTSYASQGKTVDRVFIGQGSESFPATSREQFYVSVSRAKERVTIYTDDKESLKERIRESGQRLSALELTQGKTREERIREHAEQNARLKLQAEAYASRSLDDMREMYGPPMPPAHIAARENDSRGAGYER